MATTNVDLEELFLPKQGELTEDELGTLKTEILDEELDVLDCTFNNDGCVEINTDGYTYITLSRNNLEKLLNLIDKAEEEYEEKES
jgi:hypothetical protein